MERTIKDDLPPVAIDVQNVKKKFIIYYDRGATLKEQILFQNRRRHEAHWVLKGISFQVRKGEAIGLIGENGCGKSTTLKMLTKILYPDAGKVKMYGRVSSLIELGAGFHPDMSGRENIYTNAAIFGLNKKEIDKRINDIIAFSELEEFIDNPVRTYSSGMYMRLAFAVAINVDAEILLIDEILAVGDAAFQAKCFQKMKEIKGRGTTIVIVSHALSQIEQICDRSIWIQDGLIYMEGLPREVHPRYMEYMSQKNGESGRKEQQGDSNKRWGSGEARIEHVSVTDSNGREQNCFSPQDPFIIHFSYVAKKVLSDAVVGLAIYSNDQTLIYGTNTLIDTSQPVILKEKGAIDLNIDCLPVSRGSYTIDLALHKPDGFSYDFWREVCTVNISGQVQTSGIINVSHQWEMEGV